MATMRALGLPTGHELCTPEFLWDALAETVKHRDGLQRMPLPVGIGNAAFVNDVSTAEVAWAAAWLAEREAR